MRGVKVGYRTSLVRSKGIHQLAAVNATVVADARRRRCNVDGFRVGVVKFELNAAAELLAHARLHGVVVRRAYRAPRIHAGKFPI